MNFAGFSPPHSLILTLFLRKVIFKLDLKSDVKTKVEIGRGNVYNINYIKKSY